MTDFDSGEYGSGFAQGERDAYRDRRSGAVPETPPQSPRNAYWAGYWAGYTPRSATWARRIPSMPSVTRDFGLAHA